MTSDVFHDQYQYEYQEEEEEEEEAAVWRRDPNKSFSDWTIKVLRSDEHKNDTNNTNGADWTDERCSASDASATEESVYNVHKVYLASGPRKSEYFQTLFSLTTTTKESLSKTTTLVLPESACGAFPRFLDFVYGTGNGNKRGFISWGGEEDDDDDEEEDVYSSLIANGSDNDSGDDDDCGSFHRGIAHSDRDCRELVGLAFLADYLRVEALVVHTRDRIRRSLSNKTNNNNNNCCHVFCREALLYSIDWIVQDCAKFVAKSSPSDLLLASDPGAGLLRNNAYHNPSLFDAQELSSLMVPSAMKTMLLLPHDQQIELLRKALSTTLQELKKFRTPKEDEYNFYEFTA